MSERVSTDDLNRLTSITGAQRLEFCGKFGLIVLDIVADCLDARRERDEKEREMISWRSAIQRITPGGSEFMTPEAVELWAQKQTRELGQAKMDTVKSRRERDEAQQERDSAVGLWNKYEHELVKAQLQLVDANRALVLIYDEISDTYGDSALPDVIAALTAARAAEEVKT
jgi:hypothetical protein